jgi:hypothetical protein
LKSQNVNLEDDVVDNDVAPAEEEEKEESDSDSEEEKDKKIDNEKPQIVTSENIHNYTAEDIIIPLVGSEME